MLGLMQSQPLLISSMIEFAERHHGDAEIVSRRVEGDIHRYTYRDLAARARRLANALDAQQLQFSDRVATLAWNGYRHMEMYFGVSGSGRVLHTINPRLHPDQIAWIVNHAEDQVLCFDMTFLPLVQAVHAKCPTVKQWVALCDADKLPADSGIPGLLSYEAWIGAQSADYSWPEFDENSASSMCYTSGTTGLPKAALYSHRSTTLRAYAAALADAIRGAHTRLHRCRICQNFTDAELCPVCASAKRDTSVICVVEKPRDVQAFERTREYNGLYHVLHGLLDPLAGVGAEQLTVKELLARLKDDTVKEVIMAMNPTVEGEATAMYLAKLIKPLGIRVTRLASGLPVGASLEYADETTLYRALSGRGEL